MSESQRDDWQRRLADDRALIERSREVSRESRKSIARFERVKREVLPALRRRRLAR